MKFYFFLLLVNIILYSQINNAQDWQTRFEKSGFIETSRYDETMEYFKKIEDNSEYLKMFPFGISPQGRVLNCVVISKDKAFTPAEAKITGKPIVMIECGIHAGEIEGKDAAMILLRDILYTKKKEYLIDNLIILLIPIFNVDGHERFRPYNRINQNGPKEMGWRTTSRNLNLNRDWMKADSPEMQALLKLFNSWMPDFFIDSHTTDGADYQYTVTYSMEKFGNIYSGTGEWIKNEFTPYMAAAVNKKGFLISPYFGFIDEDITKGAEDWASSPRLSTGYIALHNRPALLIETHMMKPYKDRVFSTMAVFESIFEYLNRNHSFIVSLNKRADENSIKEILKKKTVPISFKRTDKKINFTFKGIKHRTDSSPISGGSRIVYTGEPYEIDIPFYNEVIPDDSVETAKEYFILKEWSEVIERMKLHDIKIDQLEKDTLISVTRTKFRNVKFAASSYEGRQRVDFQFDEYTDTMLIPSGTFVVNTNQRGIKIITHLLEPKSGDSFIKWGFFNAIFEQKEYFEDYVMEKEAEEMLKNDPSLKKEFEDKLASDETFRNDPRQRLNFFYERSPYYDENFRVYPVVKVK